MRSVHGLAPWLGYNTLLYWAPSAPCAQSPRTPCQPSDPPLCPATQVKCNPDVAVLSTLAALGAGFDCASEAEIRAVSGAADPLLGTDQLLKLVKIGPLVGWR